jgi:High potential iron-sulfur protein
MQRKISRRSIIKSGFIAGALLPAAGILSRNAAAAELPPLDPNDPTAKALGFVNDATKVDSKTHPTFKASQKCSTCAQYQGKPGDAVAACTIFAGKSVPQGGWCQVWVQKG